MIIQFGLFFGVTRTHILALKPAKSKLESELEGSSSLNSSPLKGTLYRCPDCFRCMGYSIKSLHKHIGNNKGNCKLSDNGGHYVCPFCKLDYNHLRSLEIHTKKFNGACKEHQILKSESCLSNTITVILQLNSFQGSS